MKFKSKLAIYLIVALIILQSCTVYKATSYNEYGSKENGIQTLVVKDPVIKQRASGITWLISAALVPVYGIGIFGIIYSASSGSKNPVESDEAAQKWVKMYNKKNKTDYVILPINKSKNVERNYKWIWIKDYSTMKLVSKEIENSFIAYSPSDIEAYKALFPNSTYADSFIKRTAISADESTLLKLIEQYPTANSIDFAKKQYILLAKNYNEFNSRIATYKVNTNTFSKDEITKKASSLVGYYENVSDYLARYGFNTIYNDQILSQTLVNSGWLTVLQLETLLSWFPTSKHKESVISLLVEKTQDVNTLNSYLIRFAGSVNIPKINQKINSANQNSLLEAQKVSNFKKSKDYRRDYETIKVGKYELMATNLDVTHFRNGDPIQKAQSTEEWKKVTQNERNASINDNSYVPPAYCDHPKGSEFGKLYNWSAFATERNIAPEGWRDPTEKEWEEICKIIESNSYLWKYFKNSGYRDYEGNYIYGNDTWDRTILWVFSKTFGAHRQHLSIQFKPDKLIYSIISSNGAKSASRYRGNGLSIRLIRDNL